MSGSARTALLSSEIRRVVELPAVLPELSARQSACLLFVFQYVVANQRYPTSTEIAAALASPVGQSKPMSRQYARHIVTALIAKGCMERTSMTRRRNIQFTQKGLDVLRAEHGVTNPGQLKLFEQGGA